MSALGPHLNPDLSRRVYAGVEGTIDLVPGPNTICCVVTVKGTGERISGGASTELAAHGAHGFTSSGLGRSAAFRGVLATGVGNLQIVTATGKAITVAVTADDAYWITITDPGEQMLTPVVASSTLLQLVAGPEHKPGVGRIGGRRGPWFVKAVMPDLWW